MQFAALLASIDRIRPGQRTPLFARTDAASTIADDQSSSPLAPSSSKTGRTLNVHPQHELLTAARAQAATDTAWQDEYRRWRPPVERAIAWLVAKGNRRVPYRGVIANNIWLHHRAAALNLRRLITLGLIRTGNTWHLAPATA